MAVEWRKRVCGSARVVRTSVPWPGTIRRAGALYIRESNAVRAADEHALSRERTPQWQIEYYEVADSAP
ncbi:hypothetical protein CH293_23165 [Rhodococcus sp. 14-2470-1b]|nr:hypothetical protein CH301_18280 [Rhodococcus sp. 15-1189-1-1a]OZF11782.1 hypothetical protein CH299_18975 [Rhodococcus sp. 14-2686-1-2]OZF44428.1 hypothetical protein CH293_23165 [Rhodococcus sp. 14-2470-1b]